MEVAMAASGTIRLAPSVADYEPFERQFPAVASGWIVRRWGYPAKSGRNMEAFHQITSHQSVRGWKKIFALNTGGAPSPDADEVNRDGDVPEPSSTRLGVIVSAASKFLLDRLNAARKNFPMKIFLLLLGFYTANALATILGQTGDWDVIVAGIVVAAIEGIGMLMYKKPMFSSSGKMQSLMVMINFWKAGVCLGLFVDAFKLGS